MWVDLNSNNFLFLVTRKNFDSAYLLSRVLRIDEEISFIDIILKINICTFIDRFLSQIIRKNVTILKDFKLSKVSCDLLLSLVM